jgi:hypothetical protein
MNTTKSIYRLTKWSILCRPKDFCGLAIQNKCFLSKWLFKLINEEEVWQDLLKRKYLSNKILAQLKKRPSDSHFRSGLMKVKDEFFTRDSFRIHSWSEVRFLEDTWIEDKALKLKYPPLPTTLRTNDATVAQVLSNKSLSVSFRRSIMDSYLLAWYDLMSKIVSINLTNDKDVFVWNLQNSGIFSVHSLYL